MWSIDHKKHCLFVSRCCVCVALPVGRRRSLKPKFKGSPKLKFGESDTQGTGEIISHFKFLLDKPTSRKARRQGRENPWNNKGTEWEGVL